MGAKNGLIVIGNQRTLISSLPWKNWLLNMNERGLICSSEKLMWESDENFMCESDEEETFFKDLDADMEPVPKPTSSFRPDNEVEWYVDGENLQDSINQLSKLRKLPIKVIDTFLEQNSYNKKIQKWRGEELTWKKM